MKTFVWFKIFIWNMDCHIRSHFPKLGSRCFLYILLLHPLQCCLFALVAKQRLELYKALKFSIFKQLHSIVWKQIELHPWQLLCHVDTSLCPLQIRFKLSFERCISWSRLVVPSMLGDTAWTFFHSRCQYIGLEVFSDLFLFWNSIHFFLCLKTGSTKYSGYALCRGTINMLSITIKTHDENIGAFGRLWIDNHQLLHCIGKSICSDSSPIYRNFIFFSNL